MQITEHKLVAAAMVSDVARRRVVEALADEDLDLLLTDHAARRIATALLRTPSLDTDRFIRTLTTDDAIELAGWQGLHPTDAAAEGGIASWVDQLRLARDDARVRSGAQAAADAMADGADPVDALQHIQLTDRSLGLVSAREAASKWRAWQKRREQEPPLPLPLGIGKLMPMRMGELWCLAARPGVGKTFLSIQHSLQLATAGFPVLYISLEMPLFNLIDRFKQLDTTNQFETLPISFYEPKGALTSFDTIRSLVWSQSNRVRMVVIDHFKMMFDPLYADEYRSMNSVATQLSHLVRGGPAIMLICHINRAGAAADKIGMEHLSGTGRLEEMSDAVVLLTPSLVKLAKARYGKQGEIQARMVDSGRWTVTQPELPDFDVDHGDDDDDESD